MTPGTSPKTSGVSPAHRRQLRESLQKRARQLRGEIEAALHERGAREAAMPNRSGEADDAVADLEASLEVASVERDAAELTEVEAALARVDDPGFGMCADCGEPIAWERLRAQPQARRCVECASLAEKKAAFQEPREI